MKKKNTYFNHGQGTVIMYNKRVYLLIEALSSLWNVYSVDKTY